MIDEQAKKTMELEQLLLKRKKERESGQAKLYSLDEVSQKLDTMIEAKKNEQRQAV